MINAQNGPVSFSVYPIFSQKQKLRFSSSSKKRFTKRFPRGTFLQTPHVFRFFPPIFKLRQFLFHPLSPMRYTLSRYFASIITGSTIGIRSVFWKRNFPTTSRTLPSTICQSVFPPSRTASSRICFTFFFASFTSSKFSLT